MQNIGTGMHYYHATSLVILSQMLRQLYSCHHQWHYKTEVWAYFNAQIERVGKVAGKQNKMTAIYMHKINGGSAIIKMRDPGDYITALPQEFVDNRLYASRAPYYCNVWASKCPLKINYWSSVPWGSHSCRPGSTFCMLSYTNKLLLLLCMHTVLTSTLTLH